MIQLKLNKPTEDENIEIIEGNYDEIKDFKLDKDGYFLIKLDRENKKIVAGFCKENNNILVKISGSKPSDIYQEVLKKGLIKRADHAAYLGKECQKAYIALQQNIDYVQDKELGIGNTDRK